MCTFYVNARLLNGSALWTVKHKKRATLFSIITPVLLARLKIKYVEFEDKPNNFI